MHAMQSHLEQLGADLIGYGPADNAVAIADSFGSFEAEYAAIRRHVAVLHLPQTGVIRIQGADVKPFLHNMLSQDINAMTGGQTQRTFLLDAEGHVLADAYFHFGDEASWLELDRFDISNVIQMLDSRLFTEEVTLEDISDSRQAIALLGPASLKLIDQVATHSVPDMRVEQVYAGIQLEKREGKDRGWCHPVGKEPEEQVIVSHEQFSIVWRNGEYPGVDHPLAGCQGI